MDISLNTLCCEPWNVKTSINSSCGVARAVFSIPKPYFLLTKHDHTLIIVLQNPAIIIFYGGGTEMLTVKVFWWAVQPRLTVSQQSCMMLGSHSPWSKLKQTWSSLFLHLSQESTMCTSSVSEQPKVFSARSSCRRSSWRLCRGWTPPTSTPTSERLRSTSSSSAANRPTCR